MVVELSRVVPNGAWIWLKGTSIFQGDVNYILDRYRYNSCYTHVTYIYIYTGINIHMHTHIHMYKYTHTSTLELYTYGLYRKVSSIKNYRVGQK